MCTLHSRNAKAFVQTKSHIDTHTGILLGGESLGDGRGWSGNGPDSIELLYIQGINGISGSASSDKLFAESAL